MLSVKPDRFLLVLGGIFFTVSGLGVGYMGLRMHGGDKAVAFGMALFALCGGLRFLYLAVTGRGDQTITGSLDVATRDARAPVPARLAMLEEMHRRKAISDSEYRQQRERILNDI